MHEWKHRLQSARCPILNAPIFCRIAEKAGRPVSSAGNTQTVTFFAAMPESVLGHRNKSLQSMEHLFAVCTSLEVSGIRKCESQTIRTGLQAGSMRQVSNGSSAIRSESQLELQQLLFESVEHRSGQLLQ